jgi:hypothetical protein
MLKISPFYNNRKTGGFFCGHYVATFIVFELGSYMTLLI